MSVPQPIGIDPLSGTSVYLKLYFGETQLSTATGFIVEHVGKRFLITNWHVLSGRNPNTGKPLSANAGIPDEVRIAHHLKIGLGNWRFQREALLNPDGSHRWIEHPAGHAIDVVALELKDVPDDVQIYPFNLSLANVDLRLIPAMTISVIGFPLGLRPNAFFAIWKTGHIASDPDLPYEGRPAFLIDATTKGGMSGSPVVIRTAGPYQDSKGATIMRMGYVTKFLGVYSSRIHPDVEIGCVWRPSTITEILARAG
jgi:hypothetical protein